MKTKVVAALAGLALYAGLAAAQPFSLGLFGDTGYSRRELELLPELIAEMGREDLAFVIHDGDIKSGGSVCSDAVFLNMLDVFQASRHALVYVPGDNEWTDCHRLSNGAYDPVERLAKLREVFFAGDNTLGQRPLKLQRQSADPAFAAYRENDRSCVRSNPPSGSISTNGFISFQSGRASARRGSGVLEQWSSGVWHQGSFTPSLHHSITPSRHRNLGRHAHAGVRAGRRLSRAAHRVARFADEPPLVVGRCFPNPHAQSPVATAHGQGSRVVCRAEFIPLGTR